MGNCCRHRSCYAAVPRPKEDVRRYEDWVASQASYIDASAAYLGILRPSDSSGNQETDYPRESARALCSQGMVKSVGMLPVVTGPRIGPEQYDSLEKKAYWRSDVQFARRLTLYSYGP